MSDKDLIYRAAKVLREAAGKATPGPWVARGYGDYGPGVSFEGADSPYGNSGVECADTEDGWATTRYLPLVSPEMGLAVADWLEDAPSRRDYRYATNVARAVLAGVETADA